MQFKGPSAFEEFWSLLEYESPRGLGIVVAAYFDETLGALLGRERGDLYERIELALADRLLTQNESHDLHIMRKLRNEFAHKLRENSFDSDKSNRIEQLKTWQIAVQRRPEVKEEFPTARERLLYVAACFYLRLKIRKPAGEPLPEPAFHDSNAWPSVTSC
jgi:hypothetical protein